MSDSVRLRSPSGSVSSADGGPEPHLGEDAQHSRRNASPSIAIIVPVHNEEDSISPFLGGVTSVLDATGSPYRIVFVDDGSEDRTLERLREARARGASISIVALSRNFGKEAALTAGLDLAEAEVFIPIDVDLQDPPELILKFLEQWRAGHDIVYAVRSGRPTDGAIKRATARGFYTVFNRMARQRIPHDAGDFRLMDRRVVEELRKLRERNRFMKGLMTWPGFKSTGVSFVRADRVSGSTHMSYWRLWNLALDGVTGFSTLPLRLWTYFGAAIALVSFLFAMLIVVQFLITGNPVRGYPSLMVAVSFFGGIQLLTLGVIGEYLGRVYEEVKGRPIYVVSSIED